MQVTACRYGAVYVPQIAGGVEGIADKTKIARRYSTELFRQVISSVIRHFHAWTLNSWKKIPNVLCQQSTVSPRGVIVASIWDNVVRQIAPDIVIVEGNRAVYE
jgi:hypothetical protein